MRGRARRPDRARAAASRTSAASASASARSRSMLSQALRPWFWRSARSRWASVSSRDEIVAGAQERRHLVGMEARERRSSAASALSRGWPGTTMNSPSRRRRVAERRLGGSDCRTTSSRRMFSSSIVWAVGGMSSVSQLGEDRVLVEDVVQLALEAAPAPPRSGPGARDRRRARRRHGSAWPRRDDTGHAPVLRSPRRKRGKRRSGDRRIAVGRTR